MEMNEKNAESLHEVEGLLHHNLHKHDVVVVGAGLAALQCALEASKYYDVAVVTKLFPTRSHSGAAQGGIAATLANMEEDHWEWHMFDTIKGSDYLGDQDAIEILVKEAPEVVYELEHLGCPFSRNDNGRIAQRQFGGHTKNFGKGGAVLRACYAADRTGHVLLHTLWEQCVKNGVRFYSEFMVLSLVIKENACLGVTAINLLDGSIHIFNSKATMFGTGGYARIYKITSNSWANSGDGLSIALRAGIPIEDLEFVQFHPTGLYQSGILVTEGARGEGGYLINKDGERFMKRYAPEKMELAPRDLISRAIQTEINEGRGIDGKECVYLDVRHLGAEIIMERLPQIYEISLKFLGVDALKEPVPIQPTAHYSMGGIPTTIDCNVLRDGKNKIIEGLYAAGECACVSVHGANRLGTNSLLEATLFGRRAGKSIVKYLNDKNPGFKQLPEDSAKLAIDEVEKLLNSTGNEKVADLRSELQENMKAKCGIFRTENDLKDMLNIVHKLQEQYKNIELQDKGRDFNTELMEAIEFGHMLDFAEVIIAGALNRTESRGSHFRRDFPKRDDDNWLKHTLAYKTPEGIKFDYKPVVITRFQPKARTY